MNRAAHDKSCTPPQRLVARWQNRRSKEPAMKTKPAAKTATADAERIAALIELAREHDEDVTYIDYPELMVLLAKQARRLCRERPAA